MGLIKFSMHNTCTDKAIYDAISYLLGLPDVNPKIRKNIENIIDDVDINEGKSAWANRTPKEVFKRLFSSDIYE